MTHQRSYENGVLTISDGDGKMIMSLKQVIDESKGVVEFCAKGQITQEASLCFKNELEAFVQMNLKEYQKTKKQKWSIKVNLSDVKKVSAETWGNLLDVQILLEEHDMKAFVLTKIPGPLSKELSEIGFDQLLNIE